eukprot:COSAG01_NODE_6919_length_3434_cov_3.564371_3_plen_83_part_00
MVGLALSLRTGGGTGAAAAPPPGRRRRGARAAALPLLASGRSWGGGKHSLTLPRVCDGAAGDTVGLSPWSQAKVPSYACKVG